MKDKIIWLKNNQKQIQWAKNYLERPHIKAKIKAISAFRGSHDYSTYIGIENLLTYIKSCDGGNDFIATMANAWSKDKSNKNDVRIKVESKITAESRQQLSLIAKDLGCNLNEVFEYLLNKENEDNTNHKKKIDALKERHIKETNKLKLSYISDETVPKSLYDEVNGQLLSAQKSMREIEKIVTKQKNNSTTINIINKEE